MSSPASNLVNKVWNYCNLLRDDGVSYGDYVEQLTYLLFLKMDYERTRRPTSTSPPSPKTTTGPASSKWTACRSKDITATPSKTSAKSPGILGIIFRKAQNKIQNPAHLRRLIVDLIDKENLERAQRRRQGRHLRRPARKERPGHQIRRRPVLHAARPDRRHRRRHAPAARDHHHRSRRGHRRISPLRRTATSSSSTSSIATR